MQNDRWWRRLFGAGAVVVAVMSVIAGARAADFKDGNKLYAHCAAIGAFIGYAYCQAYVEGVADAMSGNSIDGHTACVPDGVTVQQVVDVATRYLAANPAERHFAASGLVAHALEDAFPCSR